MPLFIHQKIRIFKHFFYLTDVVIETHFDTKSSKKTSTWSKSLTNYACQSLKKKQLFFLGIAASKLSL